MPKKCSAQYTRSKMSYKIQYKNRQVVFSVTHLSVKKINITGTPSTLTKGSVSHLSLSAWAAQNNKRLNMLDIARYHGPIGHHIEREIVTFHKNHKLNFL